MSQTCVICISNGVTDLVLAESMNTHCVGEVCMCTLWEWVPRRLVWPRYLPGKCVLIWVACPGTITISVCNLQ